MSVRAEEVWKLSTEALLELLSRGHLVDESMLEERAFRGISLGVPAIVKKMTWTKFHKVFTRDEQGIRGWNVRLEQNGVDAEDEPMMHRGARKTFGHFRVRRATSGDGPKYYGRRLSLAHALILDYGLARGGGMTTALRDPLVLIEEDLLLGWSYLRVGPLQLPTPSFFTLQDAGPRDHFAVAPI